ncbi:MAG: hypothetical protein V2A61_04195 [Calditrichota bacterium]
MDPLELDPPWMAYENCEWGVFISNSGNELLEFNVRVDYNRGRDWIAVDPLHALIEPNQDLEMNVSFDSWWMEDYDYRADIHILNNDPNNGDVVVHVYIDIEYSCFAIQLNEGWNLISSPYVFREDEDRDQMPDIFNELNTPRNPSILMVKDGQGRFYIPAFNFNNIPFWNFREGYQVKMARADQLIISGNSHAPDIPIPLRQNWNLIAYFPATEVEAPVAFSNIEEVLLMAKDGSGNFYIPERDFNNMPPLRRGQGYQVKVSADVDLIWFVP